MNRILWFLLSLMCSFYANAENIVDVYGVSKNVSNVVLKKYYKTISDIQTRFLDELTEISKGKEDMKVIEKIVTDKMSLTEKIKKEGGFLFVDFQTISYPNYKNIFTTVELVNKNQPERLRYISPIIRESDRKSKPDLINDMIKYEEIGVKLILNKSINSLNTACPVYHCTLGFNHPELKPYLKIFNTGVIKEKQLILSTLTQDKNPNRRAAAAFLVGHFNNPQEIITVLLPHISDSDAGVRNNVMRVIGDTMQKAKITQINVLPFLEILDSPYITDRNKALLILLNAASSPSSRDVIIKKSGNKLISLLELTQPNNHDMTYLLLKKLSGKDFGEHNYVNWKNWLSAAQNQRV